MKKSKCAVDIYCGSVCRDEGEITQISGCGIWCLFVDGYGRSSDRSFRYGLGSSNSLDSSIRAAILGLSSIKSSCRNNKTVLYVDNQAVIDILKSDNGSDNEIRSELRTWYGHYSNITVELIADTAIDHQIKRMAETAMISQENYDSGTVFHE